METTFQLFPTVMPAAGVRGAPYYFNSLISRPRFNHVGVLPNKSFPHSLVKVPLTKMVWETSKFLEALNTVIKPKAKQKNIALISIE